MNFFIERTLFSFTIQSAHWNANHNVYAYILRANQTMRYSDDGEPQGTSGLPTLNVFQSEKIVNVCCVTTRYFGGILLGAGGLVRAYSKAAKLALDAAGVTVMRQWHEVIIGCEYALFERIKVEITSCGGVLTTSDFAVDVLMEALLPFGTAAAFRERILEISAGNVEPFETGIVFRAARIR